MKVDVTESHIIPIETKGLTRCDLLLSLLSIVHGVNFINLHAMGCGDVLDN